MPLPDCCQVILRPGFMYGLDDIPASFQASSGVRERLFVIHAGSLINVDFFAALANRLQIMELVNSF